MADGEIERPLLQAARTWPGIGAAVQIGVRCTAETLADVAKAAGVERAVLITVQQSGEGYSVLVDSADVALGRSVAVRQQVHSHAELVDGLTAVACNQFLETRCAGTLHIDGTAHAKVLIDGNDAGEVPFNDQVPIGQHRVTVMLNGKALVDQTVSVALKQDLSLSAGPKTAAAAPKTTGDFDVLPDLMLPDDSTTKPAANQAVPPATPSPAAPVQLPPPAVAPRPAVAVAPPAPAAPAVATPAPVPVATPSAAPSPAASAAAPSAPTQTAATASPASSAPALIVSLPPEYATATPQPPPQAAPPPAQVAPPAPASTAVAPTSAPKPAAVATPVPAAPAPPATAAATPSAPPAATPTAPPAGTTEYGLPPVRTSSTAWMRPAFLLSAGATGALLLTGTISGIIAQSTASDLNNKFDHRTLTLADKTSYGNVHTTATLANVAFGLSAATAVTAGVLYYLKPSVIHSGGGGDAPQVGVSPAGVTVGGKF